MTNRALVLVAFVSCALRIDAASPVAYRFSFPEPQHRWMQVDASFTELAAAPLELRMSRSSPGRYSLHDFAKNVYDVHAFAADGRELPTTRPDPYGWTVAGHDGSVTLKYKVYGDRVDGTYLGIDTTHAHINMPAAIMWARGLDDRPARVTFVQPAGMKWQVATQLHPGPAPLEFTAPNLQYLMDSPSEFGPVTIRQFTVGSRTFRFSLHHTGTDAELDAYMKDVEKIVRQQGTIYGEYPDYEPGTYTFLADYLPWANGDGMEHRNSTSLTNAGALRNPQDRSVILATVAHEFFHAWNMERLRSAGIEPFDFEDADMSDDLWLGEGFTNHFASLIQHRAGFTNLDGFVAELAGVINAVQLSPGRMFRSAVDMSRLAPFVDNATSIDRTAWPNLFISYYTYGQAIGLGLDLSLRDRSNGKVTGDAYMNALWAQFGRPGQKEPGKVSTPYTIDGLKESLAKLSGDRGFANDFFAKFVEGRDVVDYARLLGRAGLVMRKRSPGRPFAGLVQFTGGGSALRVQGLVPWESALYKAGVAQDDQLINIDGFALTSLSSYDEVLRRHKPGDRVSLRFVRRSGETVNATLVPVEDPRIEILPIEKLGSILNDDQRRFRESWLNSQQKR